MYTDPEVIFKNNKAKRLSIPQQAADGESASGKAATGAPYFISFKIKASDKKSGQPDQLLGVFETNGLEICFKVKSKSVESVITKLQSFGYCFQESV